MFRNIQHRASGSRSPGRGPETACSTSPIAPREEDDIDTISVTSTVSSQHDPDEEFDVKAVLAERNTEHGTFCLVQWDGYSLAQSTWEPINNLGAEVRELWGKEKEIQEKGERPLFDLNQFHHAVEKGKADQVERHRRRNAKRQRLGLAPTNPLPNDSGNDKGPASDEDVGDDEAGEVNRLVGRADDSVSELGEIPTRSSSNSHPGARSSQIRQPSDELTSETHRPSILASADGTSTPRPARGVRIITSQVERPSVARTQSTAGRSTAQYATIRASEATSADQGSSLPHAASVARGMVAGRALQSAGRHITAKRTGRATKMAPGNVFAGGTARKARKGLKDVMPDATREQRLFQSYRIRRLAERVSRDHEDKALGLQASSTGLFDIEKGPATRASTSMRGSPEAESHGGEETRVGQISTASDAKPRAQPVSSLAPKVDGQRKRIRKSIRFLLDEDSPTQVEPMDEDLPSLGIRHAEALFVPPDTRLDKSLRFGPGSSPTTVTMHGLPVGSQDSWFSGILARDTLDCCHSCFATTFAEQMNHISLGMLCTGAITSDSNNHILETVAAHLRACVLGLYLSQPEYNLIIYPTKCEEWTWLLPESSVEQPLADGSDLRYFIFRPSLNCGPFLRPRRATRTASEREGPPPLSRRESLSRTESPPHTESLSDKLLGWSYADLLPPVLTSNMSNGGPAPTHNFFLAFPPSEGDFLCAVYRWLRACNPDCRIFTSQQAGGWLAFRRAVEPCPGVVIVHDLASWALRRFPSLHCYLQRYYDQYWCISESSRPHSVLPVAVLRDEMVFPGKTSLTRLFPDGAAILVTPSFLTSEPERTYDLLHWFLTERRATQGVKLLSAWDLPGYLAGLVEEKLRPGEAQPGQRLSVSTSKPQANLEGPSQADCEGRLKSLLLALELHSLREAPAGAATASEDACPLIYADQSINPNDEQSLVNWFGWWSSLRTDRFREFHVVGSSQTMKHGGYSNGERVIEIPKYTQCTINDPDIVMDTVQQSQKEVDPEAAEGAVEGAAPQPDGNGPGTAVAEVPWAFRSSRIARQDFAAFTSCLRALEDSEESRRSRKFLTLYTYPVSWTDSNMAQHFRDPLEEFRTMKTWFDFSWSFVKPPARPERARTFNTFVGFFYTIDEDWDADNPPPGDRPRRHPWLAMYRPVNPHYRPYKRSQLIIWDPAAKYKFEDIRAPGENQLSYAQRYLIQLVRDLGPVKNRGTWLDNIWLGGFRHPDLPSSIDTTLEFLELLLADPKRYLPAPEPHMVDRGYRRVTMCGGDNPPGKQDIDGGDTHPASPARDDCPATGEEDYGMVEDEDSCIIFHPPRGSVSPDGSGAAGCVNRLYEEARVARLSSTGPWMTYNFQHTLEWYGAQKAEGRGYEHIHVASWEAVFDRFQIGHAP